MLIFCLLYEVEQLPLRGYFFNGGHLMARQNQKAIKVYLTIDEYFELKLTTYQNNMTISEHVRKCLFKTDYKIIDKAIIKDLLNVNADLSKLGNLLKLYISKSKNDPELLYKNLKGIEEEKARLKEVINKILEEIQ